ncbi:hypothetical protein CAP39_04250 [Sphingomonas sp. IBVSS1]|nr:hypothetical protein CAP39_04250 [Sphingomonas sp. IBVSS1]
MVPSSALLVACFLVLAAPVIAAAEERPHKAGPAGHGAGAAGARHHPADGSCAARDKPAGCSTAREQRPPPARSGLSGPARVVALILLLAGFAKLAQILRRQMRSRSVSR